MTDKWEILVVAKDNEQELGTFQAVRLDDYSLFYACADFLQIQRGFYTGSGEIGCFHVYRNDVHYASAYPFIPQYATFGDYLEGNLLLQFSDLIVAKVEPVCTCGGWVTYGKEADLHADDLNNTCDLRRK